MVQSGLFLRFARLCSISCILIIGWQIGVVIISFLYLPETDLIQFRNKAAHHVSQEDDMSKYGGLCFFEFKSAQEYYRFQVRK